MNESSPSAHLDTLAQHAERTTAEVRETFGRHSKEALCWKPAPKVWSITEVVDHLVVATDDYRPRLDAAIERAPESSVPYKPTWFGGWFVGMLAPGKRPMKTSKIFYPTAAAVDPAAVLERFENRQELLVGWIDRATGRDLNGTKLNTALKILPKISIGDALDLLVTHQRRHLEQIERSLAHPEFPGS
ncbi:MAG: DinB family protein [Acidobacteriota bacterium]